MKKIAKMLWVQVAVGLVVVGAVAWGLFGLSFSAPPIPAQLGELHLVSSITGSDAVKQMNQLHGLQNLGVIGGYIATYQPNRQTSGVQAVLWVGESGSTAGAQQLLDRMTGAMSANPTIFSAPQRRTVDGITIYATQGQGGQHYFYQMSNKVVWLQVQGAPAEDLLRDALRKVS